MPRTSTDDPFRFSPASPREKALTFAFEDIAKAFRMIDETMENVVVPWRSEPHDRMADEILDRLAATDRPLATTKILFWGSVNT